MPYLTLSDASLAFGHVPLLDHADFQLDPGERVALIGRNGTGKSSLLSALAGTGGLDDGKVWQQPGLRVGYVPQEPPFAAELTVFQAVVAGMGELSALLADYHAVSHALADAQADQASLLERMQSLQGELESRNAWSFEAQAERVIQRFSLDADALVGTLSGGQKKRLALAQALAVSPDLLLLDEPTNHLDLATREALSLALNEFEGTVIVVSHDRSLLRSVCDEFWLVTRGGVQDFAGDLDDYQRYLLDEARRNRESLRESARNAKKPASRDAAPVSAGKKTSGNLKALARDQQRIEQSLLVLQAEQRSLEARLAISLSPQDLAVIGRRLKELADEMTTLENQWLTLSDQIDMATRPIPS